MSGILPPSSPLSNPPNALSSSASSPAPASSSASSADGDEVMTNVGVPFNVKDKCFKPQGERRRCVYCTTTYDWISSSDTLSRHMWQNHTKISSQIGLPGNKRSEKYRAWLASSSSSSKQTHILIDDDDNDLPPPSSSSSFSSPTATTVRIQHTGGGKRVMAPPPSDTIKRHKSQQQQSLISNYTVVKPNTVEATRQAVNAQIDFFLYDNVALRIANSRKFREWLQLFRQGDGEVASRKQIAARQHERAESVRERVVWRLQQSKGVTVGLDGWSNVGKYKVINLVPISSGVAYYWQSIVLRKLSAAADQVVPVIAGLREILGRGVMVSAVVTDNEQVNVLLYKRLLAAFPFLIHIPCAAHTIQLCVRKAMELPEFAPVVDALTAMLYAFKADKSLRVNVRETQIAVRKDKTPLQIIRATDTRWNSLLVAAERALLLRDCIAPFTVDIKKRLAKTKSKKKRERWIRHSFTSATFWDPLQTLVEFLQPYKIATDVVQSDASSLADVHYQFVQLISKANALLPPHPLHSVRDGVIDEIKTQWNKHVNKEAVISCTLFSFDPSYFSFSDDERDMAQTWFFRWGKEYLKWYRLTTTDDDAAISALIMKQLGEFHKRGGAFSSIDCNHAVLKSEHDRVQQSKEIKQRRRYDSRHTWALCTAKELPCLVIALLSITASEAAVERTFSRQGFVHSKLRNRLSDSSVQSQMFFSFNSRALEQPDRDSNASWEELSDSDVKTGTTLLSQANEELSEEELSEPEEESEEEEEAEEKQEVEDAWEEEEEECGKEDKQYMEDREEELSPEQRLDDFIKTYVDKEHVTLGYKWSEHRQMQLQATVIAAGRKDMVTEVIKKIKKYCGDQAKSAVAEPAADNE